MAPFDVVTLPLTVRVPPPLTLSANVPVAALLLIVPLVASDCPLAIVTLPLVVLPNGPSVLTMLGSLSTVPVAELPVSVPAVMTSLAPASVSEPAVDVRLTVPVPATQWPLFRTRLPLLVSVTLPLVVVIPDNGLLGRPLPVAIAAELASPVRAVDRDAELGEGGKAPTVKLAPALLNLKAPPEPSLNPANVSDAVGVGQVHPTDPACHCR